MQDIKFTSKSASTWGGILDDSNSKKKDMEFWSDAHLGMLQEDKNPRMAFFKKAFEVIRILEKEGCLDKFNGKTLIDLIEKIIKKLNE